MRAHRQELDGHVQRVLSGAICLLRVDDVESTLVGIQTRKLGWDMTVKDFKYWGSEITSSLSDILKFLSSEMT